MRTTILQRADVAVGFPKEHNRLLQDGAPDKLTIGQIIRPRGDIPRVAEIGSAHQLLLALEELRIAHRCRCHQLLSSWNRDRLSGAVTLRRERREHDADSATGSAAARASASRLLPTCANWDPISGRPEIGGCGAGGRSSFRGPRTAEQKGPLSTGTRGRLRMTASQPLALAVGWVERSETRQAPTRLEMLGLARARPNLHS